MLKILPIIILMLSVLAGSAMAQQQNYYGANGQYLGQAQQMGNQTNYYGSNGQYLGQAQHMGNQTNYYSSNGQYQGQRLRY